MVAFDNKSFTQKVREELASGLVVEDPTKRLRSALYYSKDAAERLEMMFKLTRGPCKVDPTVALAFAQTDEERQLLINRGAFIV
jgi:hypothetical protein